MHELGANLPQFKHFHKVQQFIIKKKTRYFVESLILEEYYLKFGKIKGFNNPAGL